MAHYEPLGTFAGAIELHEMRRDEKPSPYGPIVTSVCVRVGTRRGTVTLEVDIDALARRLVGAALRNKRGRATVCAGAVRGRVVSSEDSAEG